MLLAGEWVRATATAEGPAVPEPLPLPLPGEVLSGMCPTHTLGQPYLLASRYHLHFSTNAPHYLLGNKRPLMPGLWGEPLPAPLLEEGGLPKHRLELCMFTHTRAFPGDLCGSDLRVTS